MTVNVDEQSYNLVLAIWSLLEQNAASLRAEGAPRRNGTITEYAGNYASTDRGEIWRVFIRPSGWPHLPFRSCETWQVTPETLGHKIRDSHLIVGRAQIERRADCAIKVW